MDNERIKGINNYIKRLTYLSPQLSLKDLVQLRNQAANSAIKRNIESLIRGKLSLHQPTSVQ